MDRREVRRVRTLIGHARRALDELGKLVDDAAPRQTASKPHERQSGALGELATTTWEEIKARPPREAAAQLLAWTKPALIAFITSNGLPVDTRASKAEMVEEVLQLARVSGSIRGRIGARSRVVDERHS